MLAVMLQEIILDQPGNLDPTEAMRMAQQMLNALSAKNYLLAAFVFGMLAIWLVRKLLVPAYKDKWAWLDDKRFTLVLAYGGPFLAAIITGLIAGQPFTLALVIGSLLTAVATGAGAVGLWSTQKNWREARAEAREPIPAGTVHSAVVGRDGGMTDKLK